MSGLTQRFSVVVLLCLGSLTTSLSAAEDPLTLNIWPNHPPGEEDGAGLPAEADLTKPEDRLIAGRRIIKLGNVSTPQIVVYRPPADRNTGTSVVICPGGGHHILAWDLEGTEVAEWLNGLGVTGIVLKYRVPARNKDRRHEDAVEDAQRAVSLVRSKADEWELDPDRIGILGFSAGGETAAVTSYSVSRTYEAADAADRVSCVPDFAVLIYPAYLVAKDSGELRDDLVISEESPPAFIVHAFDDPVTPQSSILLTSALHNSRVPTELHIFPTGGHGYGLRETEEPVTRWPHAAGVWLQRRGLLSR